MKKIITISVDVDTWIAAKTKVDNISAYLNECLAGLIEKSTDDINEKDITEKITNINDSIRDLTIKKSMLQADLKLIQEQKEREHKEREDRGKYNRWVCPVCNFQNPMDNNRCGQCNMRTRESPKTVIINLKEKV